MNRKAYLKDRIRYWARCKASDKRRLSPDDWVAKANLEITFNMLEYFRAAYKKDYLK